jgi:hypothetical protein
LKQEVLTVDTKTEISHLLEPDNPKAFLSYQDLFYQTALNLGYTDRFLCNTISKVKVSDFHYKSAMFLKKGSQYKEIFNHKILMIRERGFNFRYERSYGQDKIMSCITEQERMSDVEPLRFFDIFTAFLVIFIGYLISLVLLIEEHIYQRVMLLVASKTRITIKFKL